MPVWYEGRGGGRVQWNPDVQAILEDFEENYSGQHEDPIDIIRVGDGIARIELAWHDYSSPSNVGEIDAQLEKLKPHAVEALAFDFVHEEQRGTMYVGSEEQKVEAISSKALEEVEDLKGRLNAGDKIKAIELLTVGEEEDGEERK